MLTVALITVVKTWKQPKCPSTDEWVKKTECMYTHTHTHTHAHTMEYYSDIKRMKGCYLQQQGWA